MAGRSKRVLNSAPNLEQEIERNREQEEWEKVRWSRLLVHVKYLTKTYPSSTFTENHHILVQIIGIHLSYLKPNLTQPDLITVS